jgi:hypothetical protein
MRKSRCTSRHGTKIEKTCNLAHFTTLTPLKYLNTGTKQHAIGWEITIFIIREKKFEDAKWVTRKSKKNRQCSGFSSYVCLALRIRKAFIKSFNSI